ncbi:hypothetical protein PpBr36_02326 [Pyricularia pennisetigena]|uniref:hypothetical protein n=1 Tax=Pyricularia pennisetigena TaxID=1578925 RepID=UPI001151A2BC|nr:hypothetical protein PpBr36_02326 [Pyricularia pennisetigena]TLS30425.1 hypothetical protein PpBr36_02326 [Pyricularia pennisetigena]
MRAFITFCCLIGLGLVAATPLGPMVPVTGEICCHHQGTPDPSEHCKNKGLNSYCCSDYLNNVRVEYLGGCDRYKTFTTGRTVTSVVPGGTLNCIAGTRRGFIGCAA